MSELQRRTISDPEIRAAGNGPAEISGYAVKWASINAHGERMTRGAFSSAVGQQLPIAAQHRDPVGVWTDIREDGIGLRVQGRLSDTTAGRDMSTLVRDGAVTGLSIGFWPEEAHPEGDHLVVTRARLAEVSLVMVPSDDAARLTAVRAQPQPKEEAPMSAPTTTGAPDATAEALGELREELAAMREAIQVVTRDTAPKISGYIPEDNEHRDAIPDVRPAEILGRGDAMADWLQRRGIGDQAFADVRLGALIAAQANPAARARLTDLEHRALSEGVGSEGGFVVPEATSARVIDRVRNATRVVDAGAQVVPMEAPTVYYPRLAGTITPTWRSEGASVSEDDAAFERITLVARTCAVLVKMSYELFEDISPAGLAAVENEIQRGLALALDYAVLRGTGTDNEPLGIVNSTGILTAALGAGNGSTPSNFDFLVDAAAAVKAQNHVPSVAMMNSTTEAVLGKLKTGISSDNTPLTRPAYLNGIRDVITNQLPNTLTVGSSTDCSEVIVGDFSQVVIGIRPNVGFRMENLRDKYADTMQIAMLAWLRADVMIAHPEALHVTTGVRD